MGKRVATTARTANPTPSKVVFYFIYIMESKNTEYNGYFFRSRMEARWAVFFDTLNIKYHYEYMDFILSNKVRYLPDFYLPELNAYAEVKHEFTKESIEKCKDLCNITKLDVFLLEGVPDFRYYEYFRFFDKDFFGAAGAYKDTFFFYPEENRIWVTAECESFEKEWYQSWKFSIGVIESRRKRFEFVKM